MVNEKFRVRRVDTNCIHPTIWRLLASSISRDGRIRLLNSESACWRSATIFPKSLATWRSVNSIISFSVPVPRSHKVYYYRVEQSRDDQTIQIISMWLESRNMKKGRRRKPHMNNNLPDFISANKVVLHGLCIPNTKSSLEGLTALGSRIPSAKTCWYEQILSGCWNKKIRIWNVQV